jgi:signal peptidase I
MVGRRTGLSVGLLAVCLTLPVALLLVFLVGPLLGVRLAGGDHYMVRSSAMAPTVVPGDWVLALPARRPVPDRGSVVTFRDRAGTVVLSRLIGLPGETVQVSGGVVYIDGKAASMERLDDRVIPMLPNGVPPQMPNCANAPVARGGDCVQQRWRETLPDGTTEIVLNTRGQIGEPSGISGLDDTPAFAVPEGHLFFMGDNRDNSIDSRFPQRGMVPEEDVLYRIRMIHTSLDRTGGGFRPRLDRFFMVVH